MNLERLTQSDVAALLLLSTRQVRNLEREGLPARSEDGKKFYAWAEVLDWDRRRRADDAPARAPTDLEAAELRRAQAEAVRAETRVQRELGELVAIAVAVAENRRFCERVRAQILAMQSRHQAELAAKLGIPLAAAGEALRHLGAAVLAELQQDGGGAYDVSDLVERATAESVA